MRDFLNKIICVGVICYFLPTYSFSQEIMSFEVYQKIDHEEPYIYQVESNSGALLYFGSRHSFDPGDPQMDTLDLRLNQFAPDIVLTEAFPENFDYSLNRKEAIRNSGEFGLTWKLSKALNIPVYSVEPEREKEVNYLKNQGWSDTQIILYYTLKQVSQSQEQNVPFADLLPKYLASLKQRFNLDGPVTLEAFEDSVKDLLPSVENWKSIPQYYFYPGPQDPEYFTNRISTDSNIFRDKFHVTVIAEAVQKGQKVFVIVGSAHAVMQEPALRTILEE